MLKTGVTRQTMTMSNPRYATNNGTKDYLGCVESCRVHGDAFLKPQFCFMPSFWGPFEVCRRSFGRIIGCRTSLSVDSLVCSLSRSLVLSIVDRPFARHRVFLAHTTSLDLVAPSVVGRPWAAVVPPSCHRSPSGGRLRLWSTTATIFCNSTSYWYTIGIEIRISTILNKRPGRAHNVVRTFPYRSPPRKASATTSRPRLMKRTLIPRLPSLGFPNIGGPPAGIDAFYVRDAMQRGLVGAVSIQLRTRTASSNSVP